MNQQLRSHFLFVSVGHLEMTHASLTVVFQPEENSQRSDLGLGQSWIGHWIGIVFFGEWDGEGVGQKKYQGVFWLLFFLFGFLFPTQLGKAEVNKKKWVLQKSKKTGFTIINQTILLIRFYKNRGK